MPDSKNLTNKQAYKYWMDEIDAALKREKTFRTQGKQCVELYETKAEDQTPFAILYSNTETLSPAIYNARPIPMVVRRFRDADPVGKSVAQVSTRLLKHIIDCSPQDYDTFDELMPAAVLEGLITNRGLTRFKYSPPVDGYGETVVGEAVRWDKFLHGYARTWRKVPWISFEWDMSKDEMLENFKNVKFPIDMWTKDSSPEDKESSAEELTGVRTYKVYEVWDKASRKVFFISGCYKDGLLREVADPYGLSAFFPVPKPLNFMRKITTLIPTPLYWQYKSQAAELNDITRRLKHIIQAIRYRGAYNAAVEGIEKVLAAEDNQLVPVENVASMGDNTSLDKLIWTIPVNELVAVAQSLMQQRESIKQVIYEITGVSDILRGASVASETATAQNIKNQWGTLRLKKMQKEVQRYCRDCLEIELEISTKKFSLDTIMQMTGLPFLTNQKKEEFTQMGQQAAQAAQANGQQLPEVPPEVQLLMTMPTWEDIEKILRDNVTRGYKTDIETNSTIDAEAAQDKQDISELLNAMSQFLNGLGPLVQEGIMPFEIAKEMLLVISRRYNFGEQLEDAINGMQAPKPPTPDPAAAQDAEVAKATAAAKLQEIQMKMQSDKQAFDQEQQLNQQKMEIAQMELDIKREELGLQRQTLGMKAQASQLQHEQKLQQIRAKTVQSKAEDNAELPAG